MDTSSTAGEKCICRTQPLFLKRLVNWVTQKNVTGRLLEHSKDLGRVYCSVVIGIERAWRKSFRGKRAFTRVTAVDVCGQPVSTEHNCEPVFCANLDPHVHLAGNILGKRYAIDRFGKFLGLVPNPSSSTVDDGAVTFDGREVTAQGNVPS